MGHYDTAIEKTNDHRSSRFPCDGRIFYRNADTVPIKLHDTAGARIWIWKWPVDDINMILLVLSRHFFPGRVRADEKLNGVQNR